MPLYAQTESEPKKDPLEKINRKVFSFNMTMDKYVAKPVAKAYTFILPSLVRQGITNVFGNLDDVYISINGFLQGKFYQGTCDATRVIFNTTFGIFGIFDIASHIDLPKHQADFGQTLGVWGYKNSTYIVVPFLGPSTFRDSFGRVVDWYISPWGWVQPIEAQFGLLAWDELNKRANYLEKEQILEVSFDQYVFVRDAYLQKRKAMIHGNAVEAEAWSDWETEYEFSQ